MKVPFVDLSRSFAQIEERAFDAIRAVVSESSFVGGRFLEEFEQRFAEWCGAGFAVGMSSGTSAIRLALASCGVKAGDEVITVPNTFIATVEAISQPGAKPVFVDIEPLTGNMNAELVGEAVTEKTSAVIPVHLYGCPCSIEKLSAAISDRPIVVVEDACQAHGAESLVDGRWVRAGSQGAAGCFSFYPTKNLGAFGEAGAVVTGSEVVAEKLRMLRDHGQRDKNVHEIEGSNERLDSIQAAVLSVKLDSLEQWNGQRRVLARTYGELLAGLPVKTPKPPDDARHVYHLYVLLSEKRDALMKFLSSRGIGTAIHYPSPIHLQPAYSQLAHKEGDFPEAEKWAREVLSLPMFPGLRREEVEHVAGTIREFFQDHR
ncbi:MAG: DegT/DnrJ/EryC1/StrS family aminotransferase [Candidatus Eiseniibacteriota bacterium]|nr:MAG: DegT/DnrJ/EryC1/StrS family aminotransferase [Candidatus Eisenbacteria bacterium]